MKIFIPILTRQRLTAFPCFVRTSGRVCELINQPPPPQALQELDEDKDGLITKKEFIAWFAKKAIGN